MSNDNTLRLPRATGGAVLGVLRASKFGALTPKVQMQSHFSTYYSCRRIVDGLTRTVRRITKIIDKNANNSQSRNAARNDVKDKSMW